MKKFAFTLCVFLLLNNNYAKASSKKYFFGLVSEEDINRVSRHIENIEKELPKAMEKIEEELKPIIMPNSEQDVQ